jgi:hypothetical protein
MTKPQNKSLKIHYEEWIDCDLMSRQETTFEWERPDEVFVGDLVKICNGRERFWVVVIGILRDIPNDDDECDTATYYIGMVRNILCMTEEYSNGDIVGGFSLENIYDLNPSSVDRDIKTI